MTTTTETATIPDTMARQTAQAKMLREARDELAKHASRLAEAKDRKSLERIGLPEANARRLIEGGTFVSEDMAAMLGVSLPTLRNWMAPADNKVHRDMPETARMLLDVRLEQAKESAKGRG